MLVDPLGTSAPPESLGPRGGDLNGNLRPESKRVPLNVEDLGDGIYSLHKQNGFKEVACNGIKDAQPWHMMAATMMLAGLSMQDIARAAGCTPGYLSVLKAQRWFQEHLAIKAAENGKGIANLIQSEVLSSIQTIIDIRDDPEEGARTRLQAANIILEQGQGKPVQKNINFTATTSFSSLEEEEKALKEELKAIRQSIPQNLLDFPEPVPARSDGARDNASAGARDEEQNPSPPPSSEDARREASQ